MNESQWSFLLPRFVQGDEVIVIPEFTIGFVTNFRIINGDFVFEVDEWDWWHNLYLRARN